MNTSHFGAQLMTLPGIFANHFFTIPDYQRGYAWDEKQVLELLKDIDHLLVDATVHRHYTGTLVLSRPEGSFPGEFHVVDGQQRLTTLVIVLRMLADELSIEKQPSFKQLYLRRGDLANGRAVLRLNADTRQYFEQVIIGDGNAHIQAASLEAHERLSKARALVVQWLREHQRQGTSIESLPDILECKLGFLVYAPEEDAETGVMFEVINNRGKPLSELEKVKNYLIYCCVKLSAKSLRSDIDADWQTILACLNTARKTSPADEGAFLRYCLVVHLQLSKTDSQSGYDELKSRWDVDAALKLPAHKLLVIKEMADFVRFMKESAHWYAILYGSKHSGLDPQLVAVLDHLRAQERHASIMPIFLALVIKKSDEPGTLLRLLRLLEMVNFRVYMSRKMTKRNDSGQGDLYGYAASFFHGTLRAQLLAEKDWSGKTLIESEEDALEYCLVRFAIFWHAPDEAFEQSLKLEPSSLDDFYKWNGLRYFLMNYEQALRPHSSIKIDEITLSRSETKTGDYLSIEHLWAMENRNGEGENNRPVDLFEKRRLGNLVLLELRLNIQGGNDGLEEKLPRYLDGQGDEPSTNMQQVRKMVKETRRILKGMEGISRKKNYYLELHRAVNDEIENRLITFALKRWSMAEFVGFKEMKAIAKAWGEDEG